MGVNNLEKKTICQSFWPHYYETLRWQILVKKSENGKMQKLARKFEGVQISNSFQFWFQNPILALIFSDFFTIQKRFHKCLCFLPKWNCWIQNINNYFWKTYLEKFHKYFWFFHWNPYLKSNSANLLILFSVKEIST